MIIVIIKVIIAWYTILLASIFGLSSLLFLVVDRVFLIADSVLVCNNSNNNNYLVVI